MLHQSALNQENKWKVAQLPPAPTPNHNLPALLDEYNLCNLLGYNGKYPWYVVHHADSCYQTFWIDKDTKRIVHEFNEDLNLREISAPHGALKELQGRMAAMIFSKLPKHEANYAYMSGKNVRDCAELQKDGELLIRIDMKDFFGHHFEPYVRSKLCEITGYSKEICWFMAKLCSLKGSLPQGAVTSPVLSVILNYEMDVRVEAIANEYNLVYTRYADDLCFSGVDRDNSFVDNFVEEVSRAVHPFRVNWNKVDIMRHKVRSYTCGIEVKHITPGCHDELAAIAFPGFKVHSTDTKVKYTINRPVTDEEVEAMAASIVHVDLGVVIRPKRFYMQSIKRMLGMHLTTGIHYPRDKYIKMRVEAMLLGKGVTDIDLAKFKGRLAFIRMVDPGKAAKLDAVIAKYRRRA